MRYLVNAVGFDDFLKAVAAAREVPCDVVEAATGIVRWVPPAAASRAATRAYLGRLAAHKAQLRLDARLKGPVLGAKKL